MIVGQRPGASPRLLIVVLAVLAAAWLARDLVHRSAPAAKTSAVQAGLARPPSAIVGPTSQSPP